MMMCENDLRDLYSQTSHQSDLCLLIESQYIRARYPADGGGTYLQAALFMEPVLLSQDTHKMADTS